ncbi:uncharacterized protein LOC131044938 isoform X3 [Cryptomeria japonica]|uniref:uncharacterized protein LOC131044938 isoform X3 n=1 Tax=Cryptomeria japonica TaxID=3369 RepID=UPI0025AD55B0|nr:uncharacterized protein LOC131044938 isoform X3 [Cryptomeria japonica]
MANIPRLTAGSSAEQVEYCEGLITKILSRVSTRDVLKMCTVVQRWRTIIFDPSFADTHYKNSQPESIFYYHEYNSVRGMVRETFQFRSYNPKTGFSDDEKLACTLVFDFQTNSWHKGPPLLLSITSFSFYPLKNLLFLNGVIYFIAIAEIKDVEAWFRDGSDSLYMIIGYDVNQDQWCFSIFIPASVGYPHCLIEWEGNLFVCASDSTYEENQFVLAAGSTHEHYRTIDYRWDGGGGDGHFVFWKLDTEHKLWTRERELNLSHEIHTSWKVSGSSGVVWFTCGYNSLTVYHMGNRHWSTHRLDDALALRQRKNIIECVSFEPTLLSF